MISFAILGILQAIILPGLTILFILKFHKKYSLMDIFLFSVPISISINYTLVGLLVWLNIYTQLIIISIAVIEIFLITIYVSATSVMIDPDTTPDKGTKFILKIMKWCAFLPFIALYIKYGGNVFHHWDAVVSWNRWAIEWFNQTPGVSLGIPVELSPTGYPPGLPILYSLVYKFAAATNIQTLALNIAAFFPFYGILCLLRIGAINRKYIWAAVFSGIFYSYSLLRGSGDPSFIFSGYTDPILGSLAAFYLYLLALLEKNGSDNNAFTFGPKEIFIFILALSGGPLIKQNGLILSFVTLICSCALLRHQLFKNIFRNSMALLLTVVVLIHWYIYAFFKWEHLSHASSLLITNFWHRIIGAANISIEVYSWTLIAGALIGFLWNRNARYIGLFFFAPLWFFWALVVSYDFRAAYPTIPAISLMAGIGVAVLGNKIKTLISLKTNMLIWKIIISLLLIFCFFLSLPKFFAKNELLELNYVKRLELNNRGFNTELNQLFSKANLNQKSISCDQMFYNLPDAEGKFIPIGDCENEYIRWIEDPKIKYFIFWKMPKDRDVDKIRKSATKANISFNERQLSADYIIFEKN